MNLLKNVPQTCRHFVEKVTFDEDFNTLFQNSILFFKLLAKLQWNGSQNNTQSTGSLQYGLIVVT